MQLVRPQCGSTALWILAERKVTPQTDEIHSAALDSCEVASRQLVEDVCMGPAPAAHQPPNLSARI